MALSSSLRQAFVCISAVIVVLTSVNASTIVSSSRYTSCRDLTTLPATNRFSSLNTLRSIRGGDNDGNDDIVVTEDGDIAAAHHDDVTNTNEAVPDKQLLTSLVLDLQHKLSLVQHAVHKRIPKSVLDKFQKNPALVVKVGSLILCTSKVPMSNIAVFAAALAGSSLGFVSFLYFISVGYGVGVALPALAILCAFNILHTQPIPALSNLHTTMVFLWGVRLAVFLLHREFVTWKQWHTKIKEVNKRSKLVSKFSVWMSCALFYSTLVTPCLYRMRQLHTTTWGNFGKSGIALQMVGLTLESVADVQKAKFKGRLDNGPSSTSGKMTEAYYSTVDAPADKKKKAAAPSKKNNGQQSSEGNRNKLCNVGLWRYFTHPNFLGDGLFWVGTYVAGMGALETIAQILVSTFGLLATVVVLRGATEQLDAKQYLNYKKDPEFLKFRASVGFLGPKLNSEST